MWTFKGLWPERPAPQPLLMDEVTAEASAASATASLDALLGRIESVALDLYRSAGLPVRQGHYGRSPRARRWKFISERLTVEERWELALANPGWRFATLDAIGGDSDDPDVTRAARLLADCKALRAGLNPFPDATALEAAIRVGSEWRLLEQTRPLKRNQAKLRFIS